VRVAHNLYEAAPDDPFRERFKVPAFMLEMIARGKLGDKSGQGFYKRVGPAKEIYAIDKWTIEYHPAKKPKYPSVEMVRNIENLAQRLRTLVASPDRAGSFVWKLLRDHILYSAIMMPDISDRIVQIDRAMRWGYGHSLGPF